MQQLLCCCVTLFECIGLVCRAITFLWQSPVPFPANCFSCFLNSPLLFQTNWQFEVSNYFFIYLFLPPPPSPRTFTATLPLLSLPSRLMAPRLMVRPPRDTLAQRLDAKKIILRIPNKFLANNKKWTASQVLFVSLYLYFWLEKNHPFTRVFLIQFLLLLDIIFYFRTRSFLLISHPPPRFATLRIRSYPHIVFVSFCLPSSQPFWFRFLPNFLLGLPSPPHFFQH